jgi:NAD(P)H dehydrogenase (quinone)
MTYAVTGATGQLGRLVIEKLLDKVPADQIVALARNPEKAADLGVQVRAFDYDKSETLDAALEGVTKLLLISSSAVGQRLDQHRNVIAAARKAGVSLIVYTSILRADTSPISLAGEHRETEAELRASGIPFAILRNGWYTENYISAIEGALAGGAFIGSAGDGRISAAARTDYAEAAVAVLTGEGHEGKIHELAGHHAFTLAELAAEVSRQTGKNLPYKHLSEAEHAHALAGFGLDEGLARMIAGWDTAISEGALYDDGRQLSTLIGRPTTPLSEVVAAALK